MRDIYIMAGNLGIVQEYLQRRDVPREVWKRYRYLTNNYHFPTNRNTIIIKTNRWWDNVMYYPPVLDAFLEDVTVVEDYF